MLCPLQCLSKCARIIFPVHRTFTNSVVFSFSKLYFLKTKTTDCTTFCFLFVCTAWLLTIVKTKVVVSLFLTMEVETFSDTVISFDFVYVRKEGGFC